MSARVIVAVTCTLAALAFAALAVRQAIRDRAAALLLDNDGHPTHRDGAGADCPSCPPPKEPDAVTSDNHRHALAHSVHVINAMKPTEYCGHETTLPISRQSVECVLRPGHSGSHADHTGTRWRLTSTSFPEVQGHCPACRGSSLFLGSGGYVTCTRIDCPEPDAASTLLEQLKES